MEVLKKVAEEYPNRTSQIKYLIHNVNSGLTKTRNTGLFAARGEYIAHCDSDDWVEKDMYETLYVKAKSENADLVYCDIQMVYREGCEVVRSAYPHRDKFVFLQNYISSIWTCLVLVMARKSHYERHNLKSPMHISYCEDFWLTTRLIHFAETISYVPLPFYNYNRTNETSIVHTLNKKTEKEEQTAYLETIAFFEREGVLEHYTKVMSWRILKSKQELVLDPNLHGEFLEIYPESHNHIWDCPYINRKLKMMMWMLTHNLRFALLLLLFMRKYSGR